MSETTLTKEMGLTEALFWQTLPSAVGPEGVITAGNPAVIRFPARPDHLLHINLTPLPDRKIASIQLPVLRVQLQFQGFSADDQARFLKRFDLYFQRGGG